MEKILFTHYGKKGKPVQRQLLTDLMPISSPEQILLEEKRANLWSKITQACKLSPAQFESLGFSLATNLINDCQLLPETVNSYYSQSGGMLDYALNRTEAALALFATYVVADDSGEWSEEQKLWQYVLYSAAMLQGIGKLQIDLKVKCYNQQGQYLAQWNPLLTSLASQCRHYDYEFETEADVDFRRRLNGLLARRLMPEEGFAWIASNPQILQIWLALLHEDYQGAGTLGALLIRADSLALRRYFNQFLVRDQVAHSSRHRTSTFSDGTPETIHDKEIKIGATFLAWLNTAIESLDVKINKEILFMVPGGLLIGSEIFKLFVQDNPAYKNWLAVKNSFLSLRLHQKGLEGEDDLRFEDFARGKMLHGVVLSNYALVLPEEVSVHGASGEQVLSAVEFISQVDKGRHVLNAASGAAMSSGLPQLSQAGQWEIVSSAAPAASQGLNKHG